jgi:sugar lactone lactonase YvrE
MSKKSIKQFLIITFLAVMVISMSCDGDDIGSQGPKISKIDPTSGMTREIITITGTGFSKNRSNHIVTFNGREALVATATTTQLTVRVPERAGDGLVIVTVGSDVISGPPFDYLETPIISTLTAGGQGLLDGPVANAKFNFPHDVAVDSEGNIYVADCLNNRIRKIDPSGLVSTIAGAWSGGSGFVDGQGLDAKFNYPVGIVIDGAGNIYVADRENHRIRKITPSGLVSTLAGSTQGLVDGQGVEAQFDSPSGVAIDAAGNLYVSDHGNSRIRKITPLGVVSTFAGSTPGFLDGQGVNSQFAYPNGIETDAEGNVYVADNSNNRIRKITPSGKVSTLAGSTMFGSADGQGADAKFNGPMDVSIDGAGNVYVADSYNHRIRKITPLGMVSTVVGSTMGFEEGYYSTVQFNNPFGISVDALGNIYVADSGNYRIRKIIFE